MAKAGFCDKFTVMTANELRAKYLEFFKSKGHAIIPSASLIPENDPTVLFTTAGMHPLVPYLMGQKHPAGVRLANAQKCIRTSDIDEVGDNRHQTFFEMLGNWSLDDPSTTLGASYFKKEAIEWSWEFLTSKEWLGLDPQRLYITVFMGDENSEEDAMSIEVWKKVFASAGIEAEVCQYNTKIAGNKNYRIFPLPAKDNWWGPAGATGPCGPCTEMFYDTEPQLGALQKTFDEEINDFRVMEFWNDVFMEFNKTADGRYEKLAQKNVDTGMGVERTISVSNDKQNAFDNELFWPLIQKIEELSGKKYGESVETTCSMRIIADHIKAAVFILGDEKEIAPSNTGQGYVLRRLIRRAVRYGKQLGINSVFTFKVAEEVIKIYQDTYAELKKNKEFIVNQLVQEEEKFEKTLENGIKEFQNIIETRINGTSMDKRLAPHSVFTLYTSYGFPIELIIEMAKEKGLDVDLGAFEQDMKEHQELSRTASAGMFKGGLADASEQTIKYHTVAHLMLAALRQVLGGSVAQKGSNITPERLRFDLAYGQKMTAEEIKRVEDLVNEKIKQDLLVKMEEMPLEKAKATGAVGAFESKYGEKVKVYSIGSAQGGLPFSREICGGPHVERTGALGKFKIVKEEASSAGVRRIKAVLE